MTNRIKHEGTFTERTAGRWMGRIQLEGTRYTVYAGTRPEAQVKIKELVRRHEVGLQVKPINYTVQEWTHIWLEDHLRVRVRQNTFLQKASIVYKHVLPSIGMVPLQKLTIVHVQRLIREKLDSGLSPAMVQKIRNVLYAIIQYGVDADLLQKNFVRLITVKNPQSQEVKTLTKEQVQELLAAAEHHPLYVALLILVTTGIRRSELCGLKWTDINWQCQVLHVQRAVVKLGNYDTLIHAPKTNSSRRLLPLHDKALEALQKRKDEHSDTEYIFSRPDGRPIYPEVILDFLKRLGKKLGMPYLNVHMLRHTAASLLLQAGENPKIVQELLGHSSISITMDIYSHVVPGMKHLAVAKLTDMLIDDGVKSGVTSVQPS